MAFHFLKCYPTENQLAGLFQICEKTARKWGWFYAEKMQALKQENARLPLIDECTPTWTYNVFTLLLLSRSSDQKTGTMDIHYSMTMEPPLSSSSPLMVHCLVLVHEPKHPQCLVRIQLFFYAHKCKQAGG
jgi:hypothetical protein